MKYLSVCSGIEAASVAWHHLGWEPVGFAEIEKFPSQVLAHRFPGVPNLGDMTKFREWDIAPGSIDLLVGGTPCQAFSVAGIRKGLQDPRGNLALTFVAMVDHYRPEWVVWENVPGVLSSNGGRDFGAFLGALAELGYGFAYRVLDAQYFGVAQRRRRVFVVAHSSGDTRRCASVLFEPESLCGDPAPSREAGQETTADPRASAPGGGCWWDGGQVTQTLDAVLAKGQTMPEKNRFPAVLQPIGLDEEQNASINLFGTLKARTEGGGFEGTVLQPSLYESHPQDCRVTGPVEQCPTVSAKWGTGGNNTPLVTDGGTHFRKSKRAQSVNDDETWVESEVTNTMNVFDQGDVRATDVVVQPDEASAQLHMIAQSDFVQPFAQNQLGEVRAGEVFNMINTNSNASGRNTPLVQTAMHVRRLTPVECERLQGFPDGWTDIRPGDKDTPDSPRYKALGNSMAVPVMRWIGERIAKASRG